MKKKILVIGSDGYLGKYLISSFEKKSYDLDKFDIYPKFNDTKKLDVKNSDEVIKILKNNFYDVVICLVGVLPGTLRKKLIYKENLSAVLFLKEYSMQSHFIFCSSTAIYSNKKFDEEIIERPFEVYGKSKLVCEDIIKKNSNKFTIFRIGTMLSHDRSGGIMALLKKLQHGSWMWLPYGGKVVHPFVDVEDVVRAINYACDEKPIGTFDLIANKRSSFKNIAEYINPKIKIKNIKLIDFIIKFFGSDNFPMFGISRWHLNALKYDLPISRKENYWEYTQLGDMKEIVKKSISI